MKEQDFYVALRKKEIEKAGIDKQKDKITIVTPPSFTTLINAAFNLRNKDWTVSVAKGTVEFCFSVSGNDTVVTLEVLLNGDLSHLCVSVNSSSRKICVEALEQLQNKLNFCNDKSQGYILIKSYDAVSAYYCEKICKKLSKFERLLRRLLINVYTSTYGIEYYDKLSPKDNIDNAKRLIKHKSSNKIEQYSQKMLYSLTFDDIGKILFTPNWNNDDIARKQAFLDSNKNLSELSDDELRQFIKELEPKSDWKRFFENNVNYKEMQTSLNTIREFRNTISHNKFFYKNDYEQCNTLLNELNRVITSAIELTEEKQFIEEYFDLFKQTTTRVISMIDDFMESIKANTAHIVQSAIDALNSIDLPNITIP